ncbi:MAG: hypothetical protein U5K74_13075 [Gemmatimonadaceae bacterium]|nr:hypothetical protein [Gemmatimonadaceae bacterium]
MSTPRHHAESTSSPTPGNMIRTSVVVSARFDSSKPGVSSATSSADHVTPISTSVADSSASSVKIAPATRTASVSRPSVRKRA